MEEQTFFFDDFFSDDDDRGVEVVIPWKGKSIPFRIKRALTLKERQRANDAAVQIDLGKDGKPYIKGSVDQSAFTTEVLLVGLKYWPFEYSPGKPVPINRKTLAQIDGGLADQLASRILGVAQSVDQAVLDPFGKKSDEG